MKPYATPLWNLFHELASEMQESDEGWELRAEGIRNYANRWFTDHGVNGAAEGIARIARHIGKQEKGIGPSRYWDYYMADAVQILRPLAEEFWKHRDKKWRSPGATRWLSGNAKV